MYSLLAFIFVIQQFIFLLKPPSPSLSEDDQKLQTETVKWAFSWEAHHNHGS